MTNSLTAFPFFSTSSVHLGHVVNTKIKVHWRTTHDYTVKDICVPTQVAEGTKMLGFRNTAGEGFPAGGWDREGFCLLVLAWGRQSTPRDRKTNCGWLFSVSFSGKFLWVSWMTQPTGPHGHMVPSHAFDYLFPPWIFLFELIFGLETSLPPHTHTSWILLSSRFPASYFSFHLTDTPNNGVNTIRRKDPWGTIWRKISQENYSLLVMLLFTDIFTSLWESHLLLLSTAVSLLEEKKCEHTWYICYQLPEALGSTVRFCQVFFFFSFFFSASTSCHENGTYHTDIYSLAWVGE